MIKSYKTTHSVSVSLSIVFSSCRNWFLLWNISQDVCHSSALQSTVYTVHTVFSECQWQNMQPNVFLFPLTDISQHTSRGLGVWQDVQPWSSPGHNSHHQVQQHPYAASSQDSAQLGNREITEPKIWPQTVWTEALTQVTYFNPVLKSSAVCVMIPSHWDLLWI